jgi:hypothetical protein
MMVTITCSEHGDFRKQVSEHWSKGAGCPACSKANLAPQSNHLSREQWIVRFREAHGDRYGYERFVPMGSRGTASFLCPEHGAFKQDQYEHSQGRVGCAPCRKHDAAAKFFADAKDRLDDRYDYGKFEYVNAKTKSVISCPEHGEFMQNPDKHLTTKHPCPACSNAFKSKRMKGMTPPEKPRISKEEYLRRLALPERYTVNMSGYVGLTEGVIILSCPTHGESSYGPQNLLITKHKCKECARIGMSKIMTKTYEDFVTEAEVIHQGAYVYPESPDYANRKSIVTIICPSHGSFEKKAQKHLIGQGCPKCTMEELRASGRLTGGYSMGVFEANDELGQKPGTVYYLSVGNVYKIGITAMDVQRRIASIRSMSKQDVSLIQVHECSLKDAYLIEQSILKRYEDVRVARRWSTELFSEDVLRDKRIADIPTFSEAEIASWCAPHVKLSSAA